MLRRSEHTPSLSCAHCALSLTQLAKAAAMLGGASRPLFILGSQSVLMGPSRAEELASALTKLGAPCFLVGPDFQKRLGPHRRSLGVRSAEGWKCRRLGSARIGTFDRKLSMLCYVGASNHDTGRCNVARRGGWRADCLGATAQIMCARM